MPLPAGVARWTLAGKASNDEVWAFDWWTQPGIGVASNAAWQATVDAMWGVIVANALHTQVAKTLPGTGNINDLKAIYYRNSQVATYVGEHVVSPAVVGTGVGNLPLQTSLCVTLLTDIPGRSFRGRLYLPGNALSVDGNRLFLSATLAPIMAALKSVLSAGNTDGQYGPPVVVSRTRTVATKITTIRWDLRPDIQRRRANRQSDGGRTILTV